VAVGDSSLRNGLSRPGSYHADKDKLMILLQRSLAASQTNQRRTYDGPICGCEVGVLVERALAGLLDASAAAAKRMMGYD
jgi:hypothetical protein